MFRERQKEELDNEGLLWLRERVKEFLRKKFVKKFDHFNSIKGKIIWRTDKVQGGMSVSMGYEVWEGYRKKVVQAFNFNMRRYFPDIYALEEELDKLYAKWYEEDVKKGEKELEDDFKKCGNNIQKLTKKYHFRKLKK